MADDFLLSNARIIDGTGAPWFRGDVRVRDGRIVEMGPRLPRSGEVIDVAEQWLAPGFIDAHCHDDLIFLREPDRPEKIAQGVTTIVVGNCSFSLYPTVDASHELLRDHFAGLLGETDASEIFRDLASYRTALHTAGIAPNLVSLTGHAALRLAVMGYEKRDATDAEIARMQALLATQLQQGSVGISFGLVYPPSAFADARELIALGKTAAEHGKLVAAHIRSYEGGLLLAIHEFLDVLQQSGAAGLLSHLQAAGRPSWGTMPRAIGRLESARLDGVDVSFDMYPYMAGSSYMLQLLPPDALEGGIPALLQRLRDPSQRETLQLRTENGDPGNPSKVALIGWGNVQISAIGIPELKALEGLRMDAAAAQLGTSPFDLLVRCVEEDEGRTGIIMFQLSEDDVRCACSHGLHMTGSDGLPRPGSKVHPRAFGTFPRMAGRLRRQEKWFGIEDSVRRMTSIAAQRFGLYDRGVIRPGAVADLVVFSDAIDDRATFDTPSQLATGVRDVFVNGEAVLREGKLSGRRPGRVL
ncbi:N-acyl-D-amino-acid deacylase family protein [Methylovirgula sp. 4M-Z18]|uniref:N-acyl-D-amino-acid deacylase family protein n=1 Tax=Methylovirgula sp. 4M-Z18 TaxID=2293567 RepID=UPI000E2E52D8|nr:D-aminoacylase [Methylovirgula sp. 4M-Z18]RFB81482.1 D-aminoacylase [Methylovirgula sp. 4M-Z18]